MSVFGGTSNLEVTDRILSPSATKANLTPLTFHRESQVEGTESIARLTKNHHSIIQGDLHNINLALLKLAKNLRSQVSRAAIQAFTILFDTLKRSMESVSFVSHAHSLQWGFSVK